MVPVETIVAGYRKGTRCLDTGKSNKDPSGYKIRKEGGKVDPVLLGKSILAKVPGRKTIHGRDGASRTALTPVI